MSAPQYRAAREYAWCRTGVPAPSSVEVRAILVELDRLRAVAVAAGVLLTRMPATETPEQSDAALALLRALNAWSES